MDPVPKENEHIDVTVDGNDADIDIPDTRTKAKSKSRSTKGKKQQYIAEFKEAVAEPKIGEKLNIQEVIGDKVKEEIPPIFENQTLGTKSIDIVVNTEETIKDESSSKNENDIVNLFMKYISSHSLNNEISIKLDNKTRDCFMFILQNYPDDLNGFDKLLEVVFQDCKIDIEDMPEIIRLCNKINILVSKTNIDYKTSIECSRLILKFTIRVLIFEKKIKIEEDKIHIFLKGFDNLVDVCLDMLIESKTLENGCNSFFKKLLCKKK